MKNVTMPIGVLYLNNYNHAVHADLLELYKQAAILMLLLCICTIATILRCDRTLGRIACMQAMIKNFFAISFTVVSEDVLTRVATDSDGKTPCVICKGASFSARHHHICLNQLASKNNSIDAACAACAVRWLTRGKSCPLCRECVFPRLIVDDGCMCV